MARCICLLKFTKRVGISFKVILLSHHLTEYFFVFKMGPSVQDSFIHRIDCTVVSGFSFQNTISFILCPEKNPLIELKFSTKAWTEQLSWHRGKSNSLPLLHHNSSNGDVVSLAQLLLDCRTVLILLSAFKCKKFGKNSTVRSCDRGTPKKCFIYFIFSAAQIFSP